MDQHNLVPHFILDKLGQGQTQGRLMAAGLFVDVSGFSKMTDALMVHGQHGAEVLATVMREVFGPLSQSVYAQGGFIATLAGDALTCLFPEETREKTPWPAAERAFATAVAMQRQMAENARHQTPYGEFSVSAKVGLAYGEVSWGIVGTAESARAAYYFQGPAVDGCAEAEHLARAGDIVADAALFDRVQELVRGEAVDDYFRLIAGEEPLPPVRPVELPPADASLMTRFFPEQLVRETPSGEFRQVVNCFVSLPTVRTDQQLAIFMQSLFALQNRYGGLLNRLDFGDKGSNIVLFWGAPVAFENDIERAINLVLDLQTQTSIPIKAGLTYQIAHAGFIGSPLREEYTCYGRGVNLAARYMTSAPRGEVWIDAQIASRMAHRYELDYEGEQSFKGFAEPQPVYVLLERKEESESLFTGAFVGRDDELERLNRFVDPLRDGATAGTLLIWGEPGVGKSRLVHDFLDRLLGTWEGRNPPDLPAPQVFRCQADQILRHSLNPFRYWLRRHFGISDALAEARNKRNFSRKLETLIGESVDARLAAELDRTRSFLGALVGLTWPDSLYEQLDAQGRYENTFIGLSTLLRAESLRQPVVLFIEDGHLLDEDSLTFLEQFRGRLNAAARPDRPEEKPYPVAILMTARPEGAELSLNERLADEELDLGLLGGNDLVRLAEETLQGSLAPALRRLLEERSEGNPFFLEQITRYLREQDMVVADRSGRLNLKDAAALDDETALPTDVRALLVARLDRLDHEVREVVQMASILGREFDVQLLAQMVFPDEHLPRKVDRAAAATIWLPLSQLRYLFSHALLRDAAYSMQVQVRRQQLHRLAVEALERLHGDALQMEKADAPSLPAGLATTCGALAYHAEQAGLSEKARHYLERAGDFARSEYRNSQAVDYYSRALALTSAHDVERRYSLLLNREAIYNRLGDREAQRQDLAALSTLLEQSGIPGPELAKFQVAVATRQSLLAHEIGDLATAEMEARRAVGLASSNPVYGEVCASAHVAWGRALLARSDYLLARSQLEEALAIARGEDLDRLVATCLQSLGNVSYRQGNIRGAQESWQAAAEVFRSAGDRRGEASALNSLGAAAYALGDLAGVRKTFEQALAIYREVGARKGEGMPLTNLGIIALRLGDYPLAKQRFEESLALQREIEDRNGEAISLHNLGQIAADQEDYATAEGYHRAALALRQEMGDRDGEAESLIGLAESLLGQADHALARDHFTAAIDIRQALGQSHLTLSPVLGRALADLAEGGTERTAAALAAARSVLASLEGPGEGRPEEPHRLYLGSYEVLAACGDESAARALQEAERALQVSAAQIEDPDLRQSYVNNVPAHRRIVELWSALQHGDA